MNPVDAPTSSLALLVRAGPRTCAIPLASVVETMRPLPVAALPGAPPFVAGAAVVRGEPVPVVDLDALLGGPGGAASRFVTVRAGDRVTALAVAAVVGVGELPAAAPRRLLGAADAGAVEALGARDGHLLVVLRAAQLVPDHVHAAARAGAAP